MALLYEEDMESYLCLDHFDLITPDGQISKIIRRTETLIEAVVLIKDISPAFVGFSLDPDQVFFNVKSTIAQLGVDAKGKEFSLDLKNHRAEVRVELTAIGSLGKVLLASIREEDFIGKLFAKDPRRRVRDPDYLLRMFGRTDRDNLPLLSFGESTGSQQFELEKVDGYTIARLSLKKGIITYDENSDVFTSTIAKALSFPNIKTRELLALHQEWNEGAKRKVHENEMLLVRTLPLHVRTVFGHVVDEALPSGVHHTSANILQPDTKASGDVYELFGRSNEEITHIPLEFYTLEPHREHVFFSDRDQLQSSLEDTKAIFKAFDTAPSDNSLRKAVFVVKGEQLLNLTEKDWIIRNVRSEKFPGLFDPTKQSRLVQEYIENQPSYPFLKEIENGLITSQGVLFSHYFPSPLMKKMLLSDLVQSSLKGIYFQVPSQSHRQFFSHEDRSMLLDLTKFAIPVFWADRTCGKLLQFTPKPEKDTGMFVPVEQVEQFIDATAFGVYGSSILAPDFENTLFEILDGVLTLRKELTHPLLNKTTPLALITGGGPGLMAEGNRVAKKLGILSCANIVDLSGVEQEQNPYIDAKMTYRLDRLIERQAEFNLDFPIFLMGGFGTDLEFTLEGVRRKVGASPARPVLLVGTPEYWGEKITSNYQANYKNGTIAGSEWVSNCFYCVQTAKQALKIYTQFFENTLPIGKNFPGSEAGFFTVN